MKTCTKCGESKDVRSFSRDKTKKDGRYSSCKSCVKSYQDANMARIRDVKLKHYADNRDLMRARNREKYHANREKYAAIGRAYKLVNREELNRKSREKYAADRASRIAATKKYILDNRSEVLRRKKAYRELNKHKIAEARKEYFRKFRENHGVSYDTARRAADPMFKLRSALSRRIAASLKSGGCAKSYATEVILGVKIAEFKDYIESKFESGMTWHNYGDWHLDHIRPCKMARTEEELLALNMYTNFQPLWKRDNLSKGSRFTSEDVKWLSEQVEMRRNKNLTECVKCYTIRPT